MTKLFKHYLFLLLALCAGVAQAQVKFREMRKASNDYVEDIMRRTDEAVSASLAELRKTRQSIKSTQQ